MNIDRIVIDNIKRIRKEKGISQETLADACHTATSYIGLMEIYRNVPKLATIERIADALGVPPLDLFKTRQELSSDTALQVQALKEEIMADVEKDVDRILRNYFSQNCGQQ
jgi:transcriptional regulator with XRE-family HTH domain